MARVDLLRAPAVAAGVVLVTAIGCNRPAPARYDALEPRGAPYTFEMIVTSPHSVVAYGVRKYHVLRPVTLRSFRPAVVPQGVEVLATRSSFLVSHGGHVAPRGWPGTFCTNRWPMKGFGPTYGVEGLQVEADDTVTFIVYARAARPGRYVLDGSVVMYEDDRGMRVQREGAGQRAEVHVLAPGERSDKHVCEGDVEDVWTKPPPVTLT